ncbi:hypothetical protein [Longimicrobium sp.]|uniref:hypothetical protein n=1 Tax=Longimicrobium sp. TaxID=2029185 RepID=UPI002E3727A9|nr:hypothetical protein [Longimicrobium sp.]HEX6037763.1 hypothetical protein [Longimicrobium sp.]
MEYGGVGRPDQFVEMQSGPECGFEAVENAIQMILPASNDVSELDLKPWAHQNGFVTWAGDQATFAVAGYQPALRRWGIDCAWTAVNHVHLANTLRQNRVTIGVVDGNVLDPATYRDPRSYHAIVITNLISTADPAIPIIGYCVVDSNFPAQIRRFRAEHLAAALTAYGPTPLLVTHVPVAPENQANYEIMIAHPDGRTEFRFSPTP